MNDIMPLGLWADSAVYKFLSHGPIYSGGHPATDNAGSSSGGKVIGSVIEAQFFEWIDTDIFGVNI